MKFREYIKEYELFIFFELLGLIIIDIYLFLINTFFQLIIIIDIIYLLSPLLFMIYNFHKKKEYYSTIYRTMDNLEKKYFISEFMAQESFISLENEIMKDILNTMFLSMYEDIKNSKEKQLDYQEFLEIWIHEVKNPLLTLKLIVANNKTKVNKSILEELEKIENLLEQILYYSRYENLENDYVIKETLIEEFVKNAIKKHSRQIIENNIKIQLSNLDNIVKTDSKWMEFVCSQIISNSIKYVKDNPEVKIFAFEDNNSVALVFEDNGIGIKSKDLSRLFSKNFTGYNGRLEKGSTGFGLYIINRIVHKLGHEITVDSQEGSYTKIEVKFSKAVHKW